MATLEVFAHLTVRPGQLEGFKKQAAECIRITKEKDTRTLRYDWFLRATALSAKFVRRTPARQGSSSTTAISSKLAPSCSRTTLTITS